MDIDAFGKECDPNAINDLHKEALKHGRSSKQFIEFSLEIFAYWKFFYAAAVKIDSENKSLRQQLAEQAEAIRLKDDILKLAKEVTNIPRIIRAIDEALNSSDNPALDV